MTPTPLGISWMPGGRGWGRTLRRSGCGRACGDQMRSSRPRTGSEVHDPYPYLRASSGCQEAGSYASSIRTRQHLHRRRRHRQRAVEAAVTGASRTRGSGRCDGIEAPRQISSAPGSTAQLRCSFREMVCEHCSPLPPVSAPMPAISLYV
jgi:hypothetical protein